MNHLCVKMALWRHCNVSEGVAEEYIENNVLLPESTEISHGYSFEEHFMSGSTPTLSEYPLHIHHQIVSGHSS